ncbi:SMC-Scp complex subunit ScpB [Jeotgalibaca sp. MA1X17-3]|nr:SMC-Scp complex subunit ScpB [Jeotgalibaca sp. MA1X17-3]UJF14850.1 SMC-Scp complex subunit ScpB [Jeotgalibaca sp. MA1X17-3]
MFNKEAALESLLFVAGDEGLNVQEITSLLEMTPLEVHHLITTMRKAYEEDQSTGITLIETRKRYQLATKKVCRYYQKICYFSLFS